MNFRNVGVRALESHDGDIMLCDTNLRIDTIFIAEVIEKVGESEKAAIHVGRQLAAFIKKQREARLEIAHHKNEIILRHDRTRGRAILNLLATGRLRVAESAIYHYFEKHPEADDGEHRDMLPK